MYAKDLPSLTTPKPAEEPLLILGETTWRKQHRRFGLLSEDRVRHLYTLGKTGVGKSTFLQNLIIQDLRAGRGIAVLDPHGTLVQAVLPFVPQARINEVLLFRPADREYPVSFNIFRQGRSRYTSQFGQRTGSPALLTSHIVSIFKKQWSAFWGPRLEHVLRNAILAVAHDERATLVFLYRFLTDETLRERVVERIEDPVVREFWALEWKSYGKSLQAEALAPVLNKLGAFIGNPVVRAIVGQVRSRIDLRAVMDQGQVLLADLSVGELGEDASHLLGGLLLSALHLGATGGPPGARPFLLYVDEFQNFVTDAIANVLSESRKFGLGLTLAHQYLGQLPENLRLAVLGNAGTIVLFRLGAEDARALEGEVNPPFVARDLMDLLPHHIAVRLLARGRELTPFSARTLRSPSAPLGARQIVEKIIGQSRSRYAVSRSRIESSLQ